MTPAPLFAPARSSRGTLAHAIYVKDLDVFERQVQVIAHGLCAYTDVLAGEAFDPDADEHGGYRTCQRCARGVRRSLVLMERLREFEESERLLGRRG